MDSKFFIKAHWRGSPTTINGNRIRVIKNFSDEKWVSKTDDGTIKDVEPGRSVTILAMTTSISAPKGGAH